MLSASSAIAHTTLSEKLLTETYGKLDLASKPAFQGGYINFGYWKGITFKNRQQITKEERIYASEALYDLVINHLNIKQKDKILEIGSGKGYGCIKIAKRFAPELITGVDVTPEQIERSKTIHKEEINRFNPTLSFINASATKLPLPNNSYTKIYSVEAAQCFSSMVQFAKEAKRVLKKGGRLVLTAHFSTGGKGYEELRKIIPTIDQGVDRLIPIQQVRSAFSQEGFKEIHFSSIGNFVFEGLDRWLAQVEDVKWGRDLFKSYQHGYLDYYIIVYEKD